ncbi:tubulin alpha-6 chain [Wolffia australiana]
MAGLQIVRPSSSPVLGLRVGFPTRRYPNSIPIFRCSRQDNDFTADGKKEPPESLFMKELKRRGMTPTSLLEDSAAGRSPYQEEKDLVKKKGIVSSAELENSLSNQRERSMALNSEGLEGLIPRGKLLLTLGGTFFLAFGPLILVTVGFFAALYFFFGTSFVHDASKLHIKPPAYVDPYALLEEERLSQVAPRLDSPTK